MNRDKYEGNPDNVVYRSSWELRAFKWCDTNPDIRSWSSEEVKIAYVYEVTNRFHNYFIDLKITKSDGNTYLVEIKPAHQTEVPKKGKKRDKRYLEESLTYVKNQNKWKAATRYAEKRGWKFEVWTENDLMRLGIMPKALGKGPGELKPYRPYSKKPRKSR